MDLEKLRTIVGAIPRGHWMSYADVAVAAGGTTVHARTLNQRFIREGWDGAHRVLLTNGSIAPTALGDPEAVRTRLAKEGLAFEAGRAPQEARLRFEDVA